MTGAWALVSLAWRLARAGGRVRVVSIGAGNAVGTLLLLAAVASPGALYPVGVKLSAEQRNLGPTIVVFLCLPVTVLLMSVGRLSSTTRDRRLAALRLLGLSPARTRVVAAAENGLLAGVGAAAGAVLFLGLLPVLDNVLAPSQWLARPLHLSPAQVVMLPAAVVLLSVVVSLAPTRALRGPAMQARHEGAVPRPSRWRILPLVPGVLLLLLAWRSDPNSGPLTATQQLGALLAGTTLTGIGIPIGLPLAVRASANLMVTTWPGVTGQLAARRLQSEPTSTVRLVAGLAIAGYLITGAAAVMSAFTATPAYRAGQQALTTGPQTAILGVPGTHALSAAQLSALQRTPGVRHVVPNYDVSTDTCDLRGLCGQNVFIGTCADLTLSWVVRGCRDDTVSWVDPTDAAHGARTVQIYVGRGPRVTLTPSGTHLRPNRDANAARFPNGNPSTLFVPLTTPQLRHVLGPPDSYRVISAGGYPARDALQATATAHQLDVFLQDLGPNDTINHYRLATRTMATIVLTIGLAAVLLTAIDRAVERRRAIATQISIGIPLSVLRGSQLAQTLLPLWLGLIGAITLGSLTGAAYLSYDRVTGAAAQPWPAVGAMTVTALLSALIVAAATLPGVGGRLTPQLLRRE